MTLLVTLTVYLALGALLSVAMIGKQRPPITASTAVVSVIITAVLIAAMWTWWT